MIALAATLLASAPADEAATRFERMKALAGRWRPAGETASPLRIRFSLTAGGTVLVEEWTRGGRPHSLTLYHRDGARLIATHYCPQGNQPRLASVEGGKAAAVRFRFLDAIDLDATREAYLVDLSFDLADPASVVRGEIYRARGGEETTELRLVRDGDGA